MVGERTWGLRVAVNRLRQVGRWLRRMVLVCCFLAGIGLSLPVVVALLAPKGAGDTPQADLIMVFPGTPERIAAGLQLASDGHAAKLAISGISEKDLSARAEHFELLGKVTLVGSAKSRSTFEDVFNTRAIVRREGVHSLLLVTSTWHIPRSVFLLKCFLLGSGVTVHVVAVEDPRFLVETREALRLQAKLAVSETVKCWGSTLEMTWSLITGSLLLDMPRCHEVSGFIKRRVLFG